MKTPDADVTGPGGAMTPETRPGDQRNPLALHPLSPTVPPLSQIDDATLTPRAAVPQSHYRMTTTFTARGPGTALDPPHPERLSRCGLIGPVGLLSRCRALLEPARSAQA